MASRSVAAWPRCLTSGLQVPVVWRRGLLPAPARRDAGVSAGRVWRDPARSPAPIRPGSFASCRCPLGIHHAPGGSGCVSADENHDGAVTLDRVMAAGPAPHVPTQPAALPQPLWAGAVTSAGIPSPIPRRRRDRHHRRDPRRRAHRPPDSPSCPFLPPSVADLYVWRRMRQLLYPCIAMFCMGFIQPVAAQQALTEANAVSRVSLESPRARAIRAQVDLASADA